MFVGVDRAYKGLWFSTALTAVDPVALPAEVWDLEVRL